MKNVKIILAENVAKNFPDVIHSNLLSEYVKRLLTTFDTVQSVCVTSAFPVGPSWFLTVVSGIIHQGKRVPGFAFLRGNSVSITPLIFSEDASQKPLTILVREPRSPVGAIAVGSPAGMIKPGNEDSAPEALRELFEETGGHIPKGELVTLRKGVQVSPGGTDELMDFYIYKVVVSSEDYERIVKLTGTKTGVEGEDEDITLSVMPFTEAVDIGNLDMRTLLAFSLIQLKGMA